MAWLNTFLLITQLAQALVPIVRAIETVFGSGTGAQKKEAAISAGKALITTMKDVSGGGQKDTWSAIEAIGADRILGNVVEVAVDVMKASSDYKALAENRTN